MRINLKDKKTYTTALVLIILLSFILRVIKLDTLNLWRDEAFSVILAQKNIHEFFYIALKDTSSFLHNFLLFIWVRLFGINEFSVRFLSLIASMFSFRYFYLIIKRFFKFKWQYIALLLISSVNMISIYFAREARVYSILIFLILASQYYFLKLIEKFNIKTIILFIIFTTLSLYSHNLTIFIIISQILYLFIIFLKNSYKLEVKQIFKKRNKFFLNWFLIYTILFILISPYLLLFLAQNKNVSEEFWLTFSPIDSLKETLTGLSVGIRLFTHKEFTFLDSFTNILTLSLAFIGTYFNIRNFKRTKLFFSFFFWIPLTLIFLASFKTPVFYVRYASFLIPFMIVLVFEGIVNLTKSKLIQTILIIILIILNLRIYYIYIKDNSTKAHHKELVTYIANNFNSNDGIIHINALSYFPFKYYTKGKLISTIYDPEYNTPYYIGTALTRENEYTRDFSTLERFDRLWVIELGNNDSREFLNNNFIIIEDKWFDGYLYLQLWENIY